MLVTYDWLKSFIELKESPEEVAKLLTGVGNEVEDIVYQNKFLKNVVVGKITHIERHPNADRIVVCQVDIGIKSTQILTAATNVFEGAYVPVALDGADLANGIQIKNSKIRGVDSMGMFCSGEELGIDDSVYPGAEIDGILILREEYRPGMKIEEVLGLDEIIFDINITANRPDCMSVIGIARELAAILGRPIKEPDLTYKETTDKVSDFVCVDVQTPLCPRYLATAVRDVNIEKSPLWLRKKLNAVGIKAVNNIVDITNYVLIEYGQPMHAFDAENLSGKKIVVREGAGENLKVLNSNTYKLSKDEIVIADAKAPVVIAGVIGGINSSVTEKTKNVIFEAAVFNRKSIRITSKKIGVRTDSSARFERGVDLGSPDIGTKRALSLVYKLNAGKIVSGVVSAGAEKPKDKLVKVSKERIFGILGIKIEDNRVLSILNNLGLTAEINGDVISLVVPPFRTDIENHADVAEELIRMYGYDVYDKLDGGIFSHAKFTVGKRDKLYELINDFKIKLISCGFYEAINFSLVSESDIKKVIIDSKDAKQNAIKIENPISEDLGYLRTSMAIGLLNTVARNLKRGNKDLFYFESGRTFTGSSKKPEEVDIFSLVCAGAEVDFYAVKGILENLLSQFDIKTELKRSEECYLHPGKSADMFVGGVKLASFGEVHPKVLSNFEIGGSVLYAEINMNLINSFNEKKFNVNPISKFPNVERDVALIMDEDKTNAETEETIIKAAGENLVSVKLFDVYRNQSIGNNKKSMAFKLTFNNASKTLTDEEIVGAMNKVIKALEFKLGAKMR